MQEKNFFKLLNEITDWIFRIIVLNLLIISTSLLIITILPALTAGYKVFSDILDKDGTNIFKNYFKYFKEELIDNIILSTLYIILLFFIVISIIFYVDNIKNNNNFVNIFAITILSIIGVAILLSFTFMPLTITITDVKKIEYIIKLSFKLVSMYFFRALLNLAIIILPFLLLLNSFTTLLLLFSGISLPVLMNAAVTLKPRKMLEKIGEE